MNHRSRILIRRGGPGPGRTRSHRRRLLCVSCSIACVAVVVAVAALPAGAQEAGPVVVTVEPAKVMSEIGATTNLTIVVTNEGATATAPLAVHLDITNPSGQGSVDPEDWSSTLTRQIGVLGPGAVETLSWDVKPISGGDFSLYVTVMGEAGGSDIWVSDAVDVSVASRRSLNPDGVLPVAVAMPLAVAFTLGVRWRIRR